MNLLEVPTHRKEVSLQELLDGLLEMESSVLNILFSQTTGDSLEILLGCSQTTLQDNQQPYALA